MSIKLLSHINISLDTQKEKKKDGIDHLTKGFYIGPNDLYIYFFHIQNKEYTAH